MGDAETFLHEAEFLARRSRALRACGRLFAVGIGGIALCLLAKTSAPQAFQAAVILFVLSTAAAGLSYAYVLRRHWRCPVCDVAWESNDILGSSVWNHCAACGATLRAAPQQRERERLAVAEFEIQHLSRRELEARFLRRRRWGLAAFAGVVAVGVAGLVLVQIQGWGQNGRIGVMALCSGLGVATAALASRCPRCSVGLVGPGRHCARCGFALEPDAPAQPQA